MSDQELTKALPLEGRRPECDTGYSVVIPVYRNRESLPELVQQLVEANEALEGRLEVVFVIDGSPDDSHALLRGILPQQPFRWVLVALSRNFGSFAAIRAGMTEARGPLFAVMAADLQDPPEAVLDFFKELRDDKADVVVGVRSARADPLGSRIASALFWGAYRRLIQPQLPPGGVDLFGCNQTFRDHLIALDELNTSLVGLLFWLGFRRANVSYVRRPRPYGKSAWSLRRKMRYLADSVFAFSDLPIRLLLGVGTLGLVSSVLLGTVVLAAKFAGNINVPGYAGTVLVVAFFGALNTVGLGIIGGYVWRAFENTKSRPGFIVASRVENDVQKNHV
ncbi:MAG: glycosyl transferase family 2 [Bryobacterales bacterium]|nr:glycosyl transferase family 2 [Bryobacterales bacterium]